VPVVFDKKRWGLEKDWVPKNSGDEFDEMSLTLKFGLANSINTVTAYIMKQFGPHAVVDLSKKIGIQSRILAVPSLCLGTFDLSVYEMVGAYSTFVNKGVWTEPIFVTKIEDKNGVIIEEFTPKTQEAMSKETADLMVRLLQGVVDGVYSPSFIAHYFSLRINGLGLTSNKRTNLLGGAFIWIYSWNSNGYILQKRRAKTKKIPMGN